MSGASLSNIKGASATDSVNVLNATGVLPIANGGAPDLKLTQTLTAANSALQVPAGYYIDTMNFVNTTANAVTGGIKVGTTAGGADVLVALAVGANALVNALDAAILKRIFSTTVAQTLYFDAVVAWNNASVNVTIYCLPL